MAGTVSYRLLGFFAAVRAGDPRATYLSQNAPLAFLVPLAIWLGAADGNAVIAGAVWIAGGTIFTLWWLPYLRRGEHPPPGSSQTIATATSSVGAVFVPEMAALLVCFIFAGVGLSAVSRSGYHAPLQTAIALASAYFLIDTNIVTGRAFVVFVIFSIPLLFAAVSFHTAPLGHRQRLLDNAIQSSSGTAWDVAADGVIKLSLGAGIDGITKGTRLADVIHPDDARPLKPEPGAVVEYRVSDGSGGWRWLRESVDTIASTPTSLRSGVTDITAERAAIERDRRLASTDALTRQPNRASHVRESQHWAGAARGCLILVDLDDFKQINDTLGHSTGDEVLRLVAARLSDLVHTGQVARLGGDEFACLVDADKDRALELATYIVEQLRQPVSIDAMTVHSGACAGVASFFEGAKADEVRRRAGVALREAKKVGNTALRYDKVLEEKAIRTKRLAVDLPSALNTREIGVHFQPQLQLASQTIVGFEALARWPHPAHGLLEPVDFLDLVAVGGLHRQLFQATLERAIADFAGMGAVSDETRLAVNLHARNLREPDLALRTLAALEAHDLAPSRLTLELTEDALIKEDPAVERILRELDEAGVVLSADDFGSGFSSMAYLSRLPLKEMKLDQSLVAQIKDRPKAKAVVESLLQLATRLDVTVVAEGIEDEETLEYLVARGCPQGQGYLLGRPAPAAQWIEGSVPVG